MRLKAPAAAAAAIALAIGSGCGVMGGASAAKTPAPFEPAHPCDSASIEPLLELMSDLPKADPARQAELFQSAKNAASLAPTTSNRLRYALALAIPGHSAADPVAAQRQLSELLARPETLLTEERLLALSQLAEVDQRLILQSENQRLRDEAQHDSRDKQQALSRRVQAELDENSRLRKSLDEARAKLDAVTHIERSINEHGAGEPPQTPQ